MTDQRRTVVDRRSDARPDGDRRRGGRPRSETSHASVGTWLPSDVHDRLIQMANRDEMSVSAFVRRVLILTLG